MTKYTKADLLQYAQVNSLEITFENWSGCKHIHANIEGTEHRCFRDVQTHNVGLGNWEVGEKVDYHAAMIELIAADLGACEIDNCEYCND